MDAQFRGLQGMGERGPETSSGPLLKNNGERWVLGFELKQKTLFARKVPLINIVSNGISFRNSFRTLFAPTESSVGVCLTATELRQLCKRDPGSGKVGFLAKCYSCSLSEVFEQNHFLFAKKKPLVEGPLQGSF